MMIDDQFPRRRAVESFGKGVRRRKGSKTTRASRAAWKKRIIIKAELRNALRPIARRLPNAPIKNARDARSSGNRKYAKAASVRSSICPSESVYAPGWVLSASEISPGVGAWRTMNQMASVVMPAQAAIAARSRVPRRIQGPPAAMAEPNNNAKAG